MYTILFGKLAVGTASAATADEALKKAKSIAQSGQPPTIMHNGETYSLPQFEQLLSGGERRDREQ